MSETLALRLEAVFGADAVVPDALPCLAPSSEDEWVEALRFARADRLTVLAVGCGSKRGWRRPERADLALSTKRWRGVVSYEPGDGTLSARAGTTMAELARTVAEGGHHLTPDVPRPETASLGGVIAAGQSGFDRLRYGPVRNAVLGTRIALADGTIARSGGQLVKNVTGYDLHRLHCGSEGTLGVLLEVSLRLFPSPRERLLVRVPAADRATALEAARELLALPLRHHAVCAHDFEGSWTVFVALAGRAEVTEHERRLVVERFPAAEVTGGGFEAERDRVHAPALELTCLRSELAPALDRAYGAASALDIRLRAFCHPGVAQAFLRVDPLNADVAAALHGALDGVQADVRWRNAPVELPAAPPPGSELMRRLKSALDPDGVFA